MRLKIKRLDAGIGRKKMRDRIPYYYSSNFVSDCMKVYEQLIIMLFIIKYRCKIYIWKSLRIFGCTACTRMQCWQGMPLATFFFSSLILIILKFVHRPIAGVRAKFPQQVTSSKWNLNCLNYCPQIGCDVGSQIIYTFRCRQCIKPHFVVSWVERNNPIWLNRRLHALASWWTLATVYINDGKEKNSKMPKKQ